MATDEADQPDPATELVLGLLAKDIADHPAHVRSVDAGFAERLRRLTDGVEVDVDAAPPPDDE